MDLGCPVLNDRGLTIVGGRREQCNGKCEGPHTVEDACCGTGQA